MSHPIGKDEKGCEKIGEEVTSYDCGDKKEKKSL